MDACIPYGWEWLVIGLFLLPIFLAFLIIKTVLYCIIFRKAGLPWALGLLTLLPIVRIVMPLILALCDWPVLKQMRQSQQKT